MKILQVSASDTGGGAHKIATALHRGLRARGHESAMAVAVRRSLDPDVYRIPRGMSTPQRLVQGAAARVLGPFAGRAPALRPVRKALRNAHPLGYLQARRHGREFFDYPGSRRILELPPFTPDLVHGHNLHSNYFDLRYLAPLSARVPVALTLHDEWTYTGHCAYTMGIELWRTGCDGCPDLAVHPPLDADGTHENWLAKRSIYEGSRLYVSAPSRWLLDRARQSIIAAGAADFRLIPNGVDDRVFHPADRDAARSLLQLPKDPLVLLFTANALRKNPFKDYDTVAAAVEIIAATFRDRQVMLIGLGAEGPPVTVHNAEMRFVPYERHPVRVAAYYQAADLYLHAANADTFPTTVLEALAVGRPVVATAVGGIEEQVRSFSGAPGAWPGPSNPRETATGVLVPAHDPAAMAAAAVALLQDDQLRLQLGANAAADAADRFGLERQLDETIAWYADVIEDWHGWQRHAA